MLPTPPVMAVPPTTTAAIEGRRSSAASVGEPLARRPARIDAGQRREARRQDKRDDLLPADLHAGRVGRGLARPDRRAITSEPRVRLQRMRDCQHDQPDNNHIRNTENRAGDPGRVARPASSRVIERSLEITRAALKRTPPIASVAMNEGILQANVHEAGQESREGAEREGASTKDPYPRRATVSATTTLASDAIDWMERSMPPSMITKVTPVARMNRTAVSLREVDERGGLRGGPAPRSRPPE